MQLAQGSYVPPFLLFLSIFLSIFSSFHWVATRPQILLTTQNYCCHWRFPEWKESMKQIDVYIQRHAIDAWGYLGDAELNHRNSTTPHTVPIYSIYRGKGNVHITDTGLNGDFFVLLWFISIYLLYRSVCIQGIFGRIIKESPHVLPGYDTDRTKIEVPFYFSANRRVKFTLYWIISINLLILFLNGFTKA